MHRPRLLDLFSGAGGAARGYQLAGFHVTGIDIKPQPRYAGDVFIEADAITFPLDGFDAVHASPPCQDHSALKTRTGTHGTRWMLDAIRTRLVGSGLPWVVENVVGAQMDGALTLCGSEFGLQAGGRWLKRHRLFESNLLLMGAGGCMCSGLPIGGVYGTGGTGRMTRGYKFHPEDAKKAMGINWMSRAELSQAIPPVYTRHVGEQLLTHLSTSVA